MEGPEGALRLYRWRSGPVLAVALLAMAAGFGQFGVVAALGSVARAFGHLGSGATFSDEAGLSGSTLGLGLAVLRLASLGGLPLAGLADRFGRRSTLLLTAAIGLSLTVAVAFSPSYWSFIAIFALGRPALSATMAVAQVTAAELTTTGERAKAIALVVAGYGIGAGAIAIVHSLAAGALGFRGIFALAMIPLLCLRVLRHRLLEPDRFAAVDTSMRRPVLGAVAAPFRRRLLAVAAVTFGIALITGPANSLIFLYAQNIRQVSGGVTSLMVLGAGVTGFLGLLAGQRLADRLGRKPAVFLGMVGLSGFAILTYSGSEAALILGYVLAVGSGGILGPAGGAMVNELFPTGVRASVAGWNVAAGVLGAATGLVVFGAFADVGGVANHVLVACLATFLPALAFGLPLLTLPETRGQEPEDLWPPGFN